MKHLGKIGTFFLAIGTIMSIFGGYINLSILFVGMIIMIAGIGTLLFWSTSNFIWKCSKCDNEFKLSLRQNILGRNMGVNVKLLYCSKCMEKTECKGIKL